MSMRIITIDRKKWLAGDNCHLTSVLWDEHAQQGCCLGHMIHQVSRVSWDQLAAFGTPGTFYKKQDKYGLVTKAEHSIVSSPFSQAAMAINDNPNISRSEKEVQLKKLFRKHKLKLIFKG